MPRADVCTGTPVGVGGPADAGLVFKTVVHFTASGRTTVQQIGVVIAGALFLAEHAIVERFFQDFDLQILRAML